MPEISLPAMRALVEVFLAFGEVAQVDVGVGSIFSISTPVSFLSASA
jgi:hypothetical protein